MTEKTRVPDSLSPHREQWRPARSTERILLVGVVHAGATVCHVSVARTPELLARDLGEYVQENAPYQLCPGDAERVEELLGRGDWQDGVDHYFGVAEQRWGRERLVVRRVGVAADSWAEREYGRCDD
jgi:hypothetical protein